MLLAAYTHKRDLTDWPAGDEAYASTVKRTIARVIYALDNIQRDPIFVGHISDRFVRVVPWATGGLTRLSNAPVPSKTRARLNYYSCALLSSTGEVLISLDDPSVYLRCQGPNIRRPQCQAELSKQLAPYITNGGRFVDVCPWGEPRDLMPPT
jgi:hypothetical protein